VITNESNDKEIKMIGNDIHIYIRAIIGEDKCMDVKINSLRKMWNEKKSEERTTKNKPKKNIFVTNEEIRSKVKSAVLRIPD
jgi:hypothetical protein